MLKVKVIITILTLLVLLSNIGFAAGKPNHSSFYGPSGRKLYETRGSGKTTRYFTPGGRYLGKEIKYPKR